MDKPEHSLRQRILTGGVYLMTRRMASLVLGFVGLALLTRVVGPGAQGLFAAASGLIGYLTTLGLMGINVYLIREKRNAPLELFHLAFWWLLLSGLGLTLAGSGVILLAGHYWVRTEGFIPVALTLCATIPFALISNVPLALLERDLDYQITTRVEVASQLSYYVVAIPMAWLGYGVWSLVAGYIVSQLILPLGFFGATRYRPRWYWNRDALRDMLSYSFMQALGGWIYKISELAPSMVLLPLAGKEAVGYLSVVNRFIQIVGFAKGPARRLSIPTFGRVQDDLPRLTRAVNEGIKLQTLTLAMPTVAFALMAPSVLPLLLGNRWDTNILLTAFGIITVHVFLAAPFSIQSSALYVKKQNWVMLKASLAYAIVFVATVYPVTALLPKEYRLFGYLVAGLVAHVPNYWYIHRGMCQHVGRPYYGMAALWSLASLGGVFAPLVGWWLYLPAALLVLNPLSLRELRAIFQSFRAERRSKAPIPPARAD